MPQTGAFRRIVARAASKIARTRRQSDFTCGDCEQWRRCDLPPSDRCIARVEQIASANWKARRRARALIQGMPWA